MTIGEVARRTGLRTSAIRFYERAGLLPIPVRASGQRRYDASILDRIAVLERAKSCGLKLFEIGELFRDDGAYSVKWRRLAEKKISELNSATERIQAMRELLQRSCHCATETDCGRRIRERGGQVMSPTRPASGTSG
ncbi:MAG TPA: MerR family transcriptional regulator [Bryobacteraceae bacterium]|nr:MerR family transcriptional regulator [Bryobacteraceae bacterium]